MGVVRIAGAIGFSLVFGIAACGCSSAPSGPSKDYTSKFEKRVGANEQQARAFVDALSRLPAGERKTYVVQHAADARNLARIPNQDLQNQYLEIVRATATR
jgi:hypothetical protein